MKSKVVITQIQRPWGTLNSRHNISNKLDYINTKEGFKFSIGSLRRRWHPKINCIMLLHCCSNGERWNIMKNKNKNKFTIIKK